MEEADQSENWDLVIKGHTSLFDIRFRDLWRYRDLLGMFVKRDFVSFYKQTILGPLWFFIQPIFTTIVYTFIFGNLAGIKTDGLPQVLFYLSGITAWNYFADCLQKTSTVFKDNANIFGKVYFPRLIMPLSIVVSNLVRFGVQLLLLVGAMIFFGVHGDHFQVTYGIFFFPVLVALMALLGLGLGLIITAVTTKYKDLTFLVTFGVQLLMYGTTVIYPLSEARVKFKEMAWIIELNPMTGIIEAFRYAFLGQGEFTLWSIGYSAIVTVVVLMLGIVIFNKTEKKFRRYHIMSKPVIKVEDISKAYQIGQIGTGTISRDLERFWATKVRGKDDPFLKIGETNDRSTKGMSDIVWSLRDINFSINDGEAVGIIGKNGAGKSTLLKLLSRVTSPTTGQIKVKGRIASLLEVGTGFHPELSGKENIYLNGAILGMRKKEITRKLDEIIDFSGVERYIDTPVKRYSSGMYVRLAFAVAAHLESEILIVDEVLAVGDAEFQKKCLGKMGDISKGEGRTVLFVSHNMAAVKSLCNRGIVLENGLIRHDGVAESAVSYYLGGGDAETRNKRIFGEEYNKDVFKINEISLHNTGKTEDDPLAEDQAIVLNTNITFHANDAHRYHLTYHLYNELGEAMFSFYNPNADSAMKPGVNSVSCKFPAHFFQSGNFSLALFVIEDKRKAAFMERDIITFTVVDGERELGVYMGREPGYIKPQFEWKTNAI